MPSWTSHSCLPIWRINTPRWPYDLTSTSSPSWKSCWALARRNTRFFLSLGCCSNAFNAPFASINSFSLTVAVPLANCFLRKSLMIASALVLLCSTMVFACTLASSINWSLRCWYALNSLFNCRCNFSESATWVFRCSCSSSTCLRFVTKSAIIALRSWLSVSVNDRAWSTIACGMPNRCAISSALLRPGIPTNSRYVGLSVSSSNSILALIVSGRLNPYALSSG